MSFDPHRLCPLCSSLVYTQVPSRHVYRTPHWWCPQHDPRPGAPAEEPLPPVPSAAQHALELDLSAFAKTGRYAAADQVAEHERLRAKILDTFAKVEAAVEMLEHARNDAEKERDDALARLVEVETESRLRVAELGIEKLNRREEVEQLRSDHASLDAAFKAMRALCSGAARTAHGAQGKAKAYQASLQEIASAGCHSVIREQSCLERGEPDGRRCTGCIAEAALSAADRGAGDEPPSLGKRAAIWVRRCFGDDAMARSERAARLLEETVELAQAEGVMPAIAGAIVERVYSRPAGDPQQEAGGVGMCLALWAESSGIDVDTEAEREVYRVEALPDDHFRARHAAKVAAGAATPSGGSAC